MNWMSANQILPSCLRQYCVNRSSRTTYRKSLITLWHWTSTCIRRNVCLVWVFVHTIGKRRQQKCYWIENWDACLTWFLVTARGDSFTTAVSKFFWDVNCSISRGIGREPIQSTSGLSPSIISSVFSIWSDHAILYRFFSRNVCYQT